MSIKHQYALKLKDIEDPFDVVEWADRNITCDFQGQFLELRDFTYNEVQNVEYWQVWVGNRRTKVYVGREVKNPPGEWLAAHEESPLTTNAIDPVAAVTMWYFEKAMASDE